MGELMYGWRINMTTVLENESLKLAICDAGAELAAGEYSYSVELL